MGNISDEKELPDSALATRRVIERIESGFDGRENIEGVIDEERLLLTIKRAFSSVVHEVDRQLADLRTARGAPQRPKQTPGKHKR